MYKIECYVPDSHLEVVKKAMFSAGAGRVGDYDCCAWQTKGQGQYRPLEGSSPYKGTTGQLEQADEYKIELVCAGEKLAEAIAAMKAGHPYEEPAYSVVKLELF
ncbi:MAG: NGG1p interacting factor NIF3 [Pseudohongiellaceae bacterium]